MGNSDIAKHKILIVDDMPMSVKILGESLRSHFTIMVATNCKKALEIKESDNPQDLFITDISMPEMDGYQLAEAIRKMERETGGRLPIIGLTANSGCTTKAKCLDAGMDECLNKAVDTADLI